MLEDKRFRPLGGVREQQVSLRIIGATHRRLDQMVQEGRFRADLYFRLRIVEITVPPLRDRQDDVVRLAQHFLRQHAARYRLEEPVVTDAARQRLRARGPEIGSAELGFLEAAAGSAAARLLGISRDTLRYRLERLRLRHDEF